ncbi:MAG TPA: hypothetical protein VHV10_18790 [Ktedonobacteraceae bacterium]|nr:hypothetical protein [Ktedonobacteraceae bacterium]
MSLNLDPLERYRLQNRPAFREHCGQPGALVAGVRTDRNGLVMHRPDCCTELQKRLVLDDVDLTTFPKFRMHEDDFPAFRALAEASDVPILFTCRTAECRNLRETLGYQ